MDLNTLLIIAICVLLVIVLFQMTPRYSSSQSIREPYTATFDPAFIDPRSGTNTYSHNVSFRPDESQPSIDSTNKIFTHLVDENLGVAKYTEPDNGNYNANNI